jgi:hypothetical protein
MKPWHGYLLIAVMLVTTKLFGLIGLIPLMGIGWLLDKFLKKEEI